LFKDLFAPALSLLLRLRFPFRGWFFVFLFHTDWYWSAVILVRLRWNLVNYKSRAARATSIPEDLSFLDLTEERNSLWLFSPLWGAFVFFNFRFRQQYIVSVWLVNWWNSGYFEAKLDLSTGVFVTMPRKQTYNIYPLATKVLAKHLMTVKRMHLLNHWSWWLNFRQKC
jgi:hypothetical protein